MRIGSELKFCKNLPSTNNYAAVLLKNSNVDEGTIIYTNFQSAGRGQTGNSWVSEDGKNLLISIILYPSMIEPADQFLISMAVSLGITGFLDRHIHGSTIKWPNDIYIKSDKIAGILIENTLIGNTIENCVAGIGLNINQTEFGSDAPNPVSLSQLTGQQYDLGECLIQLSDEINERYQQLVNSDYIRLRADYLSRLFRKDEWCKWRDETGVFTGRIVTVSPEGRLMIERERGTKTGYAFKEIEFIL
jgi:BirA family biotin operon repressor/biotin-[acetyl-CoA-carboxylase] ligase